MEVVIRERERIVIVGSGPAAWTAAVYAGRAELDPLVVEGSFHRTMIPGGQLMFTTEVENYPGFEDGVDGQTLMLSMKAQAQRFGARVLSEDAVGVDAQRYPFEISTSGGKTIHADAIIVATGANAKWLGLPNEQRLAQAGGGVSACAVCDGALPHFRDRVLAVVGGGDSAMEEALYLTKFAREVVVVHRRDQLRASRIMAERAEQNEKIRFALNKVVTEVHGDDVITGIRLRDTVTGEESDLEVGGLFVAIGHEPNTAFLRGVVELKENGYIKMPVAWRTQTSVPGIFAAGDVMDDYYRQAVTAAGTGCMAALDAERWLAHGGPESLAATDAPEARAGRTA
ncbi:MAG TPA: thioredoxin-disulfide reductase [Longimicrobiales bacterium]|nr:thioredoxin-disulfide reductase [Longimicrobiales bacterium]